MLLAQKAIRDGLKTKVESVMLLTRKLLRTLRLHARNGWIPSAYGATNGAATDKLVAGSVMALTVMTAKDIVKNKDFLAKKSQWIFGGDGWAYDIGFRWC